MEKPTPDMTDRSNDAPGEESADLTDAQLEAANDDAAFELEERQAGEEPTLDAEAAEDEAELEETEREESELEVAEEAAEDEGMPAAPVRVGARQRAAEAAAARAAAATRGPKAPKPTRTPFAIDPALRIRDSASSAFVLASIVAFLLIFLSAMAFGRGGAFTVRPTPTPIVSQSPAPSRSPGPSGSVAPSGSPAASTAPSAAPSGPPSAAPSAAPGSSTPASTAAPSAS